MNSTNPTELERALLRSGDDLYRLALLLAPDDSAAERALIKAIRELAATGAAPTEPALIAALVAALPAERRRFPDRARGWRPSHAPAWAHGRAVPAGRAALLAALASLPHQQRLALGLTMLRSFEPEQAAELLGAANLANPATATNLVPASGSAGTPAAQIRTAVRDALLALAPVALPSPPPFALDGADAPEVCRPTRAALALNEPSLHSDAAIRGHMALCAACRAAEQAWQSLSVAVEEALRGALRDVRLPAALADHLQSAAQPAEAGIGWALLSNPRVRLGLVALPVLLLIAVLVWPRGAPPTPTGRAPAPAQAPGARELVQRAREQLYLPSAGQGIWHGHYEVQWAFPDNTTALLAAETWIEPASGRHRVQLVHHSGGGPYEFELANGQQDAWYAISENYVSSLYPLSYNQFNRVQLEVTPEERQRMLSTRLQTGAWALAAAYLRQAETAELRTWGRQRDAAGALIDLISFSGVSPLALPPDAPNATTSRVTVLLAIDEASGRLREVRELIGPTGSEQTTRTTWRQVAEEWLDEGQASSRIFELRNAWNGVGGFVKTGKLSDPALPIIRPEAITPLVISNELGWTGLWMPSARPPGVDAAFLVNNGSQPIRANEYNDSMRLTFVYLGLGRRLEISTISNAPPALGGEAVSVNGAQAIILPRNGQRYQARINHMLGNQPEGPTFTTQVATIGYTRAELLEVLGTLGAPTLPAYLSQARLFADPTEHDLATFDALLQALAPRTTSPVRHFVETVYKRQDGQPDTRPDPYHKPRYGGWPERLLQENWVRGDPRQGTEERAAASKGADGTVFGRQYLGPSQVWYYDAQADRVDGYPTSYLGPGQLNNEDQNTLLRMIACGGASLQTSTSGQRAVVLTEQSWRDGRACVRPDYNWLLHIQTTDGPDRNLDQAPYLADVGDLPLATVVGLDADGRATLIQTWAGAAESGTLLQSWELVSDETLPAERVDPSIFDDRPPDALQRWVMTYNEPARVAPSSVTITQALDLVRTPLFELPTTRELSQTIAITSSGELTPTEVVLGAPPWLNSIIAGPPPEAAGARWESEQDVFEQAVKDGFAIRINYTVTDSQGNSTLANFYQGSEQTFGAYLRSSAAWTSSSAETLAIGGKPVSGWRVTQPGRSLEWLLFELDGTLIAVQDTSIELRALLTLLQPVTR
ncbi:MAG TPA: hypothetical protein VFU22_03775 [Roseiflexaceae bacterium]|nr:hypothetical protein [Roseiflexaceae bacterium]